MEKFRSINLRRLAYPPLIIFIALYMLLSQVPISLHSAHFRSILFLVGVVIIAIEVGRYYLKFYTNELVAPPTSTKVLVGLGALPLVIVLGITGINIFNGPIFRADDYSQLIQVEEKSFEEDYPEIDLNQIPLMDRDTAQRLGDRQLGSMNELVSQFVTSDSYTQISIQGEPYRVTPLEYASFIRWFNNRDTGIPAYLLVNMVSGEVEVINVEEGMKYTDSEYFLRNVNLQLYLKYPTTLFREPSFEVDDEGHPHYVATTYKNIFAFRQLEPDGVIVLDAVTGETEKYALSETPNWIDRVYASDIIIDQLDMTGLYNDGYLNSIFGQQGVRVTTDGYNYLSIGDDIFLYTGVTSVNSDASNIGFYLVNLRTKEGEYYPATSADEFSAMASAEGEVQHTRYTSTFPLLITIEGRPYYISSLKDESGLVRSYALVDAQDYQDVTISNTMDELVMSVTGGETTESDESDEVEEVTTEEELLDITGTVENIEQAVVAGDTIYYFMIDGSVFKANIHLHDNLPFVEPGDEIEGQVNESNEFKVINLN